MCRFNVKQPARCYPLYAQARTAGDVGNATPPYVAAGREERGNPPCWKPPPDREDAAMRVCNNTQEEGAPQHITAAGNDSGAAPRRPTVQRHRAKVRTRRENACRRCPNGKTQKRRRFQNVKHALPRYAFSLPLVLRFWWRAR